MRASSCFGIVNLWQGQIPKQLLLKTMLFEPRQAALSVKQIASVDKPPIVVIFQETVVLASFG